MVVKASKTILGFLLLHSFTIELSKALEFSSNTTSKSYPITTLLNAKWIQTPLYLEISEYLADENPNLYWDYIQKVVKLDTPLEDVGTESKQYLTAFEVAQKLLSKSQLPLLNLVVSMHSLVPRIQAHFQIARQVRGRGDCNAPNFVTVNNEIACTIKELITKLNEKDFDSNVETYSFDHVFPGSENNTKVVVLYGDIGSMAFAEYHNFLKLKALNENIKYINRHHLIMNSEKKVRLSGYGVELHLKSTEYKSQDDSPKQADETERRQHTEETEIEGFDFAVLKSKFPNLAYSLDQLRNSLLQKNEEIALLKAWEFQDLGLQAAERVVKIKGEESLQILEFTAQNFPTQAKTLLIEKVSDEIRKEISLNIETFGRTLNIVPPDAVLFINGLFFDSDTIELNSLLESLRSEIRVMESLYLTNIKGKIASSLLALDLSSSSTKDFAIDIRDSSIMWINNIEIDPQYKRWPSSVMDLLRPMFPGMLRNIRKNIFNLVLVVDPLQPNGRSLIKLAESFVIHTAPVRVGLIFDTRRSKADSSLLKDYVALFCAFNYVTQNLESRSAIGLLTDIFAAVESKDVITAKYVRTQLKKKFNNLPYLQIDEILSEDSDFDYGRKLSEEFIERLGFKTVPQALLNGVPMSQNLLHSDSDFEEAIFTEIVQQTSNLQKSVYRGDLTDAESVIDYLMNQSHVMPRLNQRILSNEESKFIDFTGKIYRDLSNVRALALLSNCDMTATLMENIKYFTAKHSTEKIGNTRIHFLTLWIIADLDTSQGRELLYNALEYMRTGSSIRIAFIPNSEGEQLSKENNMNRLVWAAAQTLSGTEATQYALNCLKKTFATIKVPQDVNDIISDTELHIKMLRVYNQRVLNLKKSERMVIANGKMYGPLANDESFTVDDFNLIDRFNSHQYGDKIRKVLLSNTDEDLEISSDTLLKLFGSLVPRQTKTRFNIPAEVRDDFSVIKLPPNRNNEPNFEITAVIDPASRGAQKLAPILILLRRIVNCNMRVFLCPVSQHSDMPVKNFYRYVVDPEVQFCPNGKISEGPMAKFSGLPSNPLLTQNLQVSENWLVEVVRSVYDLDNIKLSEIGGPVHSEFELEYLLLEGHCFDSASGAPPRGLQVTLGTPDNPTIVDTIVMANLGYFQLKANPGIWELRLRDGKSSEIYNITNAEGPNTVHINNSTRVVISSLRSHAIKLRVTKKTGMNNADLQGDEEDASPTGIWNSITSSFGGSSPAHDTDSETINIFSVASGHLYERLLRIMMVSLLKHTKYPVKFWFLKNYLSPQFTDFLPHMAREYHFQYELVQYKWPRWLHQQTEKQRTIWGYKILFLDVLFPLNIRKIIFVDADAIVRSDIKELYNLDLNGAPYAYTPFCDSRKEMEGFRFWKQGYWRSHLMGRRYHISALYVVDLKKFRKIAAGDRLRGQYQALSQDPNSLSNLDQDLPNNMIHQVAIKSLPDEWLWCETWCSDSSFKSAKVIDLCNNPQTKEAKLTAAQRIVPEWKDYDLEIKKLLAKIEDHENSEHYEYDKMQKTRAGNRPGNVEKNLPTHSEL